MPDYPYGSAFQEKILSLFVRKPKTCGFIEPSYFQSPIHTQIAVLVKKLYKKFPDNTLTKDTVLTVVKGYLGSKRREIWPAYKRTIKEIFAQSATDDDVVAAQAVVFARERRYRQALVAAEQDINNSNYEAPFKRFAELREAFAGPQARVFHTFEDFEKAPPLSFAIEGFLQRDALTLIGGLSGHGKTWVMLSMVKALLTRQPLWGHFNVPAKVKRVLYLVPESSLGPFKHRLKRMHIYRQVEKKRLLVHTLSAGPQPKLDDPQILAMAKGAHIFLDTAIRFGEGEENVASDNQKGLAQDVFTLLCAGAKTITGAHHSPKSFSKEWVMTLENILRGSGDIGAMAATVWGVKKIDEARNTLHIQNVKPRDFEPCKPFQIQGRPWIDQEGDFRMLKKPGTCGPLLNEQPQRGGAPVEAREQRAKNQEAVRKILEKSPKLKSEDVVEKLHDQGIHVEAVTVRKYKRLLREGA